MKLFTRVTNRLIFPAANAYLTFQSAQNWVRSWHKDEAVIFERDYDGRNVMLFVIYEKGNLRSDVRLFLEEAKAQNIFVVCVNTLKLTQPERYHGLIDCYIERYNYGRDFGSYQAGFEYVFKRNIEQQCPRLLMVNDSVFFSSKHNQKFLSEMFASNCEVLGATENHEIEHHLGSFCIAYSGAIIRNQKFRLYWQRYKNTDVRPVVIRRGEMGLSRVLRGIVSSPDNYRALYDTTRAIECLKDDPELLNILQDLSRTSQEHWDRYALSTVIKRISGRYLFNNYNLMGFFGDELKISELDNFSLDFVVTLEAIADFFFKHLVNVEYDRILEVVRDEAISHFAECFAKGSQIHQNNIFLHYVGLPIIKLDGLYRGILSVGDVGTIAADLEESQVEDFRRIMLTRPYGGDVLYGWKRAAFHRGLI